MKDGTVFSSVCIQHTDSNRSRTAGLRLLHPEVCNSRTLLVCSPEMPREGLQLLKAWRPPLDSKADRSAHTLPKMHLLRLPWQGSKVWPKAGGITIMTSFRSIGLSEGGGWGREASGWAPADLKWNNLLSFTSAAVSSSGSCPTKCDFKHLSANAELQI